MSILSLGCSNKPIEKEMKMPMLFDTREQADKEAYKLIKLLNKQGLRKSAEEINKFPSKNG